MAKRTLPLVLDAAFVFTAAGFAAFAVLRFYTDGLWLAAIAAAVFGLLVASVFTLYIKRRSAAYDLKKKDAEEMELALSSMCLMTDDELNAFFCDLFDKMRLGYTMEDGHIVLDEAGAAVRYYFTFSEAYEGKIIEAYKQTGKGQRLIVLGRSFPEELYKLTDRFAGRITLVGGAELYLIMKRYELLPPVKEELKKDKKTINLPRALFSKRRARQYFLYGLTLEFFSFFVLFPTYYVCFGTALIAFSVICYFFGIKEEPKSDNPFRAP